MSAWLLLFSLLLPFAQSAFSASQGVDATLPACCRTHGKHKCAMRMMGDVGMHSSEPTSTSRFAQVTEKCPYAPALVVPAHLNPPGILAAAPCAAYVDQGPRIVACASINRSFFSPRANYKRGPPYSN